MNSTPTATRRRSSVRRALRWGGVTLILVIILTALAALWVWFNRYDLIERQAITYLDARGIEADLDIRSATGTSADIRNVRLSQDGEPFLRINRLRADYQWRDLLNGRVERLDFDGLEATITVDETGRITDGWMPPQSSSGGGGLPPDGIRLTDSRLQLNTPYGELPLSGDAQINATDRFAFEGRLGDTVLTWNETVMTVEGPIAVERNAGPFRLDAPGTSLSVTHPSATLNDTVVAALGTFDPATQTADGTLSLLGGRFEARAGVEGRIDRIAADGEWTPGQIRARVETELRDLSVTDPERRRTLARTLSLAGALSEVPIAQNFAPDLVDPLGALLAGSDLSASADLELSDTERRVDLLAPLTLTAERASVELTRTEDETSTTLPFYRHQPGSGLYDIRANATLDPVPLSLEPLALTIRTTDGFSVEGVEAAAGRVRRASPWRATTREGRPARLGPLSVGFDYNAPQLADTRLILTGRADYDGDVPGGYMEGLRAGGRLSARLDGSRTRLDFDPDAPIRFDRLDTTSEWSVTDFQGTLQPGTPLLVRRDGRPIAIRTDLNDATFTAVRPETDMAEAAELMLDIASAALSGSVGPDRQDWSVEFTELALASETFPVPGTDLTLPSGALSIALSADARTDFTLTAPDSILLTPAYSVRGMALNVAGTAEAYELSFQGGRVRVIPQTDDAVPLPVLPASGTLIFRDGAFTGQARAALPNAPDTPFDIDYRLSDGGGDADVRIRGLRFRPAGLQPQDLAPALRGKIALVDGTIDADLNVRFGGDTPLSGTGTVRTVGMSLATPPGPVTGLSGVMELDSLFPLTTPPGQSLTVEGFDPGFPFENGEMTYQLSEAGVIISRAVFPIGQRGEVGFEPFTWTYGAPENRVVLRVSGVEIGDYLRDIGDGRLTATGVLEGTIPVVVRGIDVKVERGRVEVPGGGTISYTTDNPNPNMALRALENFDYDALFAEVDGALDGNVTVGMEFTGSNPDVLFDVPFAFDVTVEGELFNIARNLNPNGLQQRLTNDIAAQVSGQRED